MATEDIWILSILTVIILFIFFHISIKVISCQLRKKYGIKLKIGGYGIFCFRDIQLHFKDGLKLEIEYAGLSSYVFNSAHKSFIVFYINELRLQGDTNWIISQTASKKTVTVKKKDSVFPLHYFSILKFISFYVLNASVMQLGKSDEEFLLHLSFQELHLFCKSSIQLNASVISSSVKIFKHLPIDLHEEQSTEACICHFSSNLNLSFYLMSDKSSGIQSINLNIAEPELMLYEGFSVSKFKAYIQNLLQVNKIENKDESIQKDTQLLDIRQKLKKMPKVSDVAIDLFSVKLMMKGGHRTFLFGIRLIAWHFEIEEFLDDQPLPSIASSIQVEDISAASDHIQIGQLLKFSVNTKVANKVFDLKLNLSLMHLLYEKEVFQYFLSMLLVNTQKGTLKPASNVKKKKSVLALFSGFKCNVSMEVDDICTTFKIPKCELFSFGLVSGQCTLEHHIGSDESFSQAAVCGSNLELLIDTVYLKLGDSPFTEFGMLKRYHFSNIPVSIGVILLKTRLSNTNNCIKCMLDGSQLQWCPNLCDIIFYLQKFVISNFSSHAPADIIENAQKTKSLEPPTVDKIKSIELNFSGLNIFALNEFNNGIAIRTDAFNISSMAAKSKITVEGLKLFHLPSLVPVYQCIRSPEIKNYSLFIQELSVVYLTKKREVNLIMSEDIYLLWSTTLHMATYTIVQEGFAFEKSIQECYELNSIGNTDECKCDPMEKPDMNQFDESKVSQISAVYVQATGRIDVGWSLSKKHKFVFSSSDVNMSYSGTSISANSEHLAMVFDNNDVFVFKKVFISLMPGNEQNQLCRQGFDDLELPNNRILSFRFDHVKFVFPFKYNFAEAFSEEFINIIKWLKIIHKRKKVHFTLDSKLPPDLQIICKLWTIELSDDPFEVKLRDNFELLNDEHEEIIKRKQMLDQKIDLYRRTNLLLPSEKINLLYTNLAQKSAGIYIHRSQQMYLQKPMRTHLCLWTLEDIDITAIADTSYHGTERVVSRIKSLDPESPYPDEGLEFTTLWGRKVRCTVSSWTWTMRDFSQNALNIRELHIWGFLIGAEQEASQRAKRSSVVEIDEPWGDFTIERSMPALKFYHDLTFDMEEMSMAYGPSWEPVMAQINLAMELVSRPSLDPSPALPWWDKMRLLYHGRFTLLSQHLSLFLRASLDPYNNTENMEIVWSEVFIEWTNGKILTKGNLDMYVHTASKYDDIRVLHIPHLKLSINFDWLCLGNPYDHHNVMPCAPNKVPEYSINQEHDSYRAFRSQNLNISYSYETKHMNPDQEDVPTMLLYSSTLRWIENLKMILSGVTRLTRRGVLFSNVKPRKPQLSRHYHRLCVSLNLHKFKIIYWMSFAKQRGLELVGGRLSLSLEHTQTLTPIEDGLKHRPRSNWNIGYFNSELCDSEIWLYNQKDDNDENPTKSFNSIEQSYFLSVDRVSYAREEIVKDVMAEEDKADIPTHRLVVHGLKGAWTKHNKLVTFSLFDSYQKTVLLKKNLSTEALRCFKVETQNTPQKLRSQTNSSQNSTSAAPSPASNLQSSQAASMLQKLVAESEANSMVFIEEMEGSAREQQLYGVAECQTDDVLQKKWLIELVNSQVMLKGCETSGYVIVSAAKAKILQRLHMPVWKDRSLVSKTSWTGSFECMQYYATVDAGSSSTDEQNSSVDDILWLSLDNIEERESMVISDIPDLVGSGHSVGGVVSSTVGATSDPQSAPTQLQRIVSRCGCQFFYASFGENVDPNTLEEVPPLPEDNDLWEKEVAVDSFTLTHHDLDICTNSLQYAMILDLVNNLLLYVEPRKKELTNKLQYMRFQLQLCSIDDQRAPILQIQEKIRTLLSNLRRLEKEAYAMHKFLHEDTEAEYLEELSLLDEKIHDHKEQLNLLNEQLTMMISCFKETQIIATRSRQRASSQEKGISTSRRSEVCFKHAQWRLTDADGQLGISDLILSNFLYSKVSKTDDSVEHLLELGYIKMTNLLPNQTYKIVLQPTELQTKIPLDRRCMLRIFCREKAPVGGISIKEHLEVNVVAITIGLTDAFYKAMLKFFFPGRDTDKADDHSEDEEPAGTTSKKTRGKSMSTFYGERDDIEKMKERADKNHTFISIKIPEVPIRVSYKGKKEKNLEDVHDLSLTLSTIEYYNRTWTWLDLLMALKNDAKKILLSQAIKQKILKSSRNIPEKDTQPLEDEKASILLGTQYPANSTRTLKKGFFNRRMKDH